VLCLHNLAHITDAVDQAKFEGGLTRKDISIEELWVVFLLELLLAILQDVAFEGVEDLRLDPLDRINLFLRDIILIHLVEDHLRKFIACGDLSQTDFVSFKHLFIGASC